MIKYILVFLICLGGSLIQGISGFGYSIFVMAFLPLIMPLKVAAVVVPIQTIFMGGYIVFKLRKNIDFKMVAVPLVTSILCAPVGVYLLLIADENILRKMLGGVIILFAVFAFINGKNRFRVKANFKNGVIAGLTSGIMSGMFNIGGPPLVIYFLHAADETLTYKASLEFIYASKAVSVFISHLSYGNVDRQVLEYAAAGLLGSALGCFAGLKLFMKLDKKILGKAVCILMFALGLLIMFR